MDILWDNMLILVAVVYAGLVVILYAFMIVRFRKRRYNNKKTYDLLQKCILNGTIVDSFGLDLICRVSQYEEFEIFVKNFLRYSLETRTEEEYQKIDALIRTIVIEKSKKKPFEACSPTDRQMLLAINEIVAKGDNDAAKYSMQELSRSLAEKDEKIHKQRNMQIGLTFLTILGLAINIVFGILGLSLSEKDVQTIKQTVETVMQSDSTIIVNK